MPIFTPSVDFQELMNSANYAEIRALVLNADFTIANPKTFSGQIQLTGQSPTDDNSAMTRKLTLKEQMFSLGVCRPIIGYVVANNSGSGLSGASDNTGWYINGSTTASAWQRIAITRNLTTHPGWTGGSNNAAVPFAFAWMGQVQGTAGEVNTEFYMVVGDSGTGAPPAFGANKLTGRGFGFRVYYSTANSRFEVKLFVHDGTTYAESATGEPFNASSPSSWFHNTILATDGAGTIKLFDGVQVTGNLGGTRTAPTPLITLTGGPTSGNYASFYISAFIVNNSSAPAYAMNARQMNSMLHTGEVY